MRRLALAVLVAALLAVPAVQAIADTSVDAQAEAEASGSAALEPRGSILIEGDDELANHSAVRGGNGSASNPYRIQGWVVAQDNFYGVWIANVTSHILIKDVFIDGSKLRLASNIRCTSPMDPCRYSRGLFLRNVSNARVDSLQVQDAFKGIHIYESGSAQIENSVVGVSHAPGLGPGSAASPAYDAQLFEFGIDATDTTRLSLENVTASNAALPVVARHASSVAIRDATVTSPAGDGIRLLDVDTFELERASLANARLRVKGAMSNLSVSWSSFVEGRDAFTVDPHPTTIDSVSFCGNRFQRMTHDIATLKPSRIDEIQILGNAFTNVDAGIAVTRATGVTGEIRRNILTNMTDRALGVNGGGLEAHNNTFENNTAASILDGSINASWNWWGSPRGPSIDGPGDGDPVFLDEDVTIRPWRKTHPAVGPSSVECDAPEGEPGAKQGSGFSLGINGGIHTGRATAGAGVEVGSGLRALGSGG